MLRPDWAGRNQPILTENAIEASLCEASLRRAVMFAYVERARSLLAYRNALPPADPDARGLRHERLHGHAKPQPTHARHSAVALV